ncbi:hypothetical protein ALQ17_02265 [Pseudomonas fluorescens]|nr:hypothetical protein ALQ17_02265 [Pseudomonas fluorescens]
MPVDVLHHHNGVIHHQADRQHHREQCQQVDAEAEQRHQTQGAQHRQRNTDDGDDHAAHRAQAQVDDHHHDQDGLDQRFDHFDNRGFDKVRSLERQRHLDPWRQGFLDVRQQALDVGDDQQRVALGCCIEAQVYRGLGVHQRTGFVGCRTQLDGRDIAQAQQVVAVVADDHVAKLIEAAQVGVDLNRGDHIVAFDLPGRCLEVVVADRLFHLGGTDAVACHTLRVEPQAHGQALAAEGLDLGHAVDRGKQRLHHAAQVIAQGRGRQRITGKPHVRHRCRIAGGTFDHRVVGLFRQAVFDLVDLGNHIAQRLGRVLVECHAQGDLAAALHR